MSSAETAGVPDRLALTLRPGEELIVENVSRGLLDSFFEGKIGPVCSELDGRLSESSDRPKALVSGSFNPVHAGHWALLQYARERSGAAAAFELSVVNVDKPALSISEVRRRLGQFHGRAPVWLTKAPTFVEKARLFPGCTFVIGGDTAARLVEPRYYRDSATELENAAEIIRNAGCRFVVAPRRTSKAGSWDSRI